MKRKKEEHHVNKRRLTVRLAATTRLVSDSIRGMAGATTADGMAVVIEVAPDLLATSRRQGGLLQTSGIVEAEGLIFGLLAIRGDESGHLVVVPLGTPEVTGCLKRSTRWGPCASSWPTSRATVASRSSTA